MARSCTAKGYRKPKALQAAGGPCGTRCSRWSSSYDTSPEAPGRRPLQCRRADTIWIVVIDLVVCPRVPILFVLVRVTAYGQTAGALLHLELVLVLLVVCDDARFAAKVVIVGGHPYCLASYIGVQAGLALLATMHCLPRHAALACRTLMLLARHARAGHAASRVRKLLPRSS